MSINEHQLMVTRSIKALGMDKPSIIRCANGDVVVVQTAEQRDPTKYIMGIKIIRG